jgi:NAD(P)-dependent dehydrogenase (short-subunit alcohol dehydrogenase family)/glyoxylase-like metal-dependent hydrolase (beta-lactamase superfamily II)
MKSAGISKSEMRAGPDVVLITGCSTGIGRATAVTLAQTGYRLVATARHPETLDGLGADLALPLDVTDSASIGAAVQAVVQRFGRIDILINNAGYAMRGAIEEVDVEAVGRMIDTNVLGTIRMVQAVTPVMRRQGSGRIVNVGSLVGKLSGPSNGTYAATKHAVEALTDALRWELELFGIQVVLVEPGAIRSAFEQTVARESGALLGRQDSPYAPLYARFEAVSSSLRKIQAGPETVAHVILNVVRADNPHARYTAAVPLLAQIAMQLPDPAKDLVVRRLYGMATLPRQATPRPRRARRVPAEEIAEDVWQLSVYGTNVYFVRSGAGWVLVDAAWAWGDCGRAIRGEAEAMFGPGARPAAILLTHLHPDHDGTAQELAQAWNCPVYLHVNELPLARAAASRDFANIERWGNGLDRGIIVPLLRVLSSRRAEALRIRPSLADVARVLDPAVVPSLPDWTWVHTPGHAPGHVAFFRARDRVLLAGDAVLTMDASSVGGWLAWALGTRPPHAFAPPGYTNWNQGATDASLAVLAALESCVLASGHGAPLVGDAAACELHALAERPTARQARAAVAA